MALSVGLSARGFAANFRQELALSTCRDSWLDSIICNSSQGR